MLNAKQILNDYFGYDEFRSPQQEIIQSVLNKNDTLALLPTGGGKSLCFQVPALMQEGICIVVTPLIALMKDQVSQLKNRNIKAAGIFSGLSYNEIDIILDNCQFGYYKFLYVSPERLTTEIFIERFKQMKVNLIAVDEAHCISQWGYDFRPTYLQIAEIRKYHSKIPVLALTASATPDVQKDIIEKLLLKDCKVFKKSFLRENLSFVIRREEGKYVKLLEIIQKIKGSGIVYVRNRYRAKEVSVYLNQHQVKADYYHAGLNTIERSNRQEGWIKNKIRVIVCTNAFGMGIDKQDVRFVIHLDVPESLEAYYQEAGRAGRDGKLSYAALLYNTNDISKLNEVLEAKFPPAETIKKVYNAICNHLEISVESGKMQSFSFDFQYFCAQFKLESTLVYNCIKILVQENYLQLNENDWLPSRVIFKVDKLELYKFEVANSTYALLIKYLLRTYGGIMDHYTKVSEIQIASKLKLNVEEVVKQLKFLHKQKIINYVISNDKPTIVLLEQRLHDNSFYIDLKYLQQRKKTVQQQLNGMINYTIQKNVCRQIVICTYFGESKTEKCGICDICIEEKNKTNNPKVVEEIKLFILEKTKNNWVKSEDILPQNAHFTAQLYKEVIRFLIDEKMLEINDKNELRSV